MKNPSIERVEIDPRELLVDVNIRKDVRLDNDFVASIKELGVLVPITAVRTSSGEIRVRFGHRRTLAAIEAGLDAVPADVIGNEGEDDAAAIERIITQHAENVHRAGLTSAEKVEVVAQLSAFGVKASEITKKTRIPRGEVSAAKAVSESELAKEASERYDFLTLEQAAAVAEFEDNREAVKVLVAAAQQGRFDHALKCCVRTGRKPRRASGSRRSWPSRACESSTTPPTSIAPSSPSCRCAAMTHPSLTRPTNLAPDMPPMLRPTGTKIPNQTRVTGSSRSSTSASTPWSTATSSQLAPQHKRTCRGTQPSKTARRRKLARSVSWSSPTTRRGEQPRRFGTSG